MRFHALALATAGLLASGCHGGAKTTPTQPLPDAASLIPVAPAPQPSATPTPGSEPPLEPLPAVPGGGGAGAGGDTSGAGCGAPVPPAVSRFNVKIQASGGDRLLLDSTPLVGPDAAYCKLIGFSDGRSFCPVRTEGSADRQACEAARVGRASDTGRAGPTWTVDGRPCASSGSGTWCQNHGENQYLAWAYGSGTFRACAASGVCGEITVE